MNSFPDKILLATDGSEDAALAARAAVALSAKTGSELHVVHVWHDIPTPHYHSFVRDELEREAREVLGKQVKLIEDAGGVVAKAHLRMGRTIDEILDLGEEIEVGLLIVGSRGLGSMKRILLGSVSEGIVHHTRHPVLVMRGGENAWPPARIIVGDDSSEDARKAGELAASIGKLFGAPSLLVRVYPKPLDDNMLLQAERDLEDRADRLEGILGRPPQIRINATTSDPAIAILETAEEEEVPTLITVGSRGIGAIGRVRLGSVSTKVVRAARGPVLMHLRSQSTGG